MEFKGGGGSAPPVWQAFDLEPGLEAFGDGFSETVEVAMDGTRLVFKGMIATPGGLPFNTVLGTIPAEFPAPTTIRRLAAQGGTSGDMVALNLSTNRELSVASIPGDWISLDGVSVYLP